MIGRTGECVCQKRGATGAAPLFSRCSLALSFVCRRFLFDDQLRRVICHIVDQRVMTTEWLLVGVERRDLIGIVKQRRRAFISSPRGGAVQCRVVDANRWAYLSG